MGNKQSKQRSYLRFLRIKKVNNNSNDDSVKCEYVDTIRDANFSWLEGRRVSADDFYPMERYAESTDRLAILIHNIFKYILRGNAKVKLTAAIKRCLHIGSGHYIWLLEMANDHKEIQFEGFDITPTTENGPKSPLPSNVKFTHGSIFEKGLPYPDEYFDYVNIRSFLAWLPSDKIPLIIDEVRRVTKRGGLVEILEMDVHLKNGTPFYEEKLGKIWRDICTSMCYDPKNIINLKESLEKNFFEIKNSKLSVPIGRYGGKVGELYAEAFICGSNAISADVMKKTLNMTDDEMETYLQECLDDLNLNQSYNNFYLVCAKKKF